MNASQMYEIDRLIQNEPENVTDENMAYRFQLPVEDARNAIFACYEKHSTPKELRQIFPVSAKKTRVKQTAKATLT